MSVPPFTFGRLSVTGAVSDSAGNTAEGDASGAQPESIIGIRAKAVIFISLFIQLSCSRFAAAFLCMRLLCKTVFILYAKIISCALLRIN